MFCLVLLFSLCEGKRFDSATSLLEGTVLFWCCSVFWRLFSCGAAGFFTSSTLLYVGFGWLLLWRHVESVLEFTSCGVAQ